MYYNVAKGILYFAAVIIASSKWGWRWLCVEGDTFMCIPNSDGLFAIAIFFFAVRNVESAVALIVVEDKSLTLCPDKCNTNGVAGKYHWLRE